MWFADVSIGPLPVGANVDNENRCELATERC